MESRESIKKQKKQKRKEIKQRITELDSKYCREADRKIIENVFGLEEFQQAKTIFCYVSTETEVDTIPILKEILASGKRLGVPKCTGKGIMEVYEISSLDELTAGAYGILEPDESCKKILLPEEIDFSLIPCISCDSKGKRLGHGGGYYDRYLEQSRGVKAIVCRSRLMLDEIPTEPHDVQMDLVISEEAVWRMI